MTTKQPIGTLARKFVTSIKPATRRTIRSTELFGEKSEELTVTMEKSSALSEKICLLEPWEAKSELCFIHTDFKRTTQEPTRDEIEKLRN